MAETKTLNYTIGTIVEEQKIAEIKLGESFRLPSSKIGKGDYLLLTIVVPDDREKYAYNFEVLADGEVINKRGGETRGVGRRSFFTQLDQLSGRRAVELSVRNTCREALPIRTARILRDFETYISQSPENDDFTLSLLVNRAEPEMPLWDEVKQLRPAPGVRLAFSSEVYYTLYDREGLQHELDQIKACSEKHDLPFYVLVVSWWAGTAWEVRYRLDFQQICWSETDDYDEGKELRELLGDKWDIRYGLTTPNRWSSTPWQTMNNPELNELRWARMTRAVQMLETTMKGRLLGYISENEPAYWAGDSFTDQYYPVKRRDLWADFNPHTIAAAAADGVKLDPADGLDLEERMWLLNNVSRYAQKNIDVLRAAGASEPLYTHMLLAQMFPMEGTGRFRPYGETTRVRGARPGLETVFATEMDGLWRVREWGNWACVNREENDGHGLDYHVAMLQAIYMMGADMLNSYNWHQIKQNGRAIGYFNEFLDNLQEGGVVVAGERGAGNEWLPVGTRHGPLPLKPAFPWGNMLELNLRAGKADTALEVELTKGRHGPTIAYRVLHPSELNSKGATLIDFGDIGLVEQREVVWLRLRAEDEDWEILGAGDKPNYRLLCDLPRERRRSQFLVSEAGEHIGNGKAR